MSCLCLDKRWDERSLDLAKMAIRLEDMGTVCESFKAGDGTKTDIKYDYIDKPESELTREVAQWGYGIPGSYLCPSGIVETVFEAYA